MTRIAPANARTDLALASLAVLNVNWHSNARSYLDSFVPFAIEGLRLSNRSEATESETCEAVRTHFGISIPAEVMGGILRRAIKQGIGSRLSGGAFRLEAVDGAATLQADLAKLLREQADLETALADFARERFSLNWDQKSASTALMAYVEDSSARMVVANYQGATPQDSFETTEPERLTVAAFINEIWTAQPQRFEYLLNVAKGSFLATTMFFQTHFDQTRKFRNTTLYLDTGVVLGALGYEGPARQAAALEWIRLAHDQEARLATFETTVREARGVLQYALSLMKAGRGWEGRPGSVVAYFYEQSLSPGMITTEISSIEAKLRRLRIELHSLPDQDRRRHLQIDEDAVEVVLNEGTFPYANDNALHHDSRVLGAMIMLRNRGAQDRFEESRAVFVTGNFRVVRASRKAPDLAGEPWPVAMHVNDVAVLLWIKVGSDASDLPRKQLLASCLAILRPSEPTWTKYVAEIRGLEARGSIADADIALIAQQNERDRTSLIESIKSTGKIEVRSPSEVLDEAREAVAGPARTAVQSVADAKVAELEAALGASTAEAQLANAELEAIRAARRRSLATRAKLAAAAISLVAVALLTGTVVLVAFNFGVDLGIVLGSTGLLIQVLGLTIPFGGRSLFAALYERLLKRATEKAGL